MSKMNQYKELANKFADLIEKNEAPWQKSWSSNGFLPYNIKTGKEYNGMNLLNLMMVAGEKGYEDTRWLTFLQAGESGGKVRAGEKGVHIMYLQTKETIRETDEITGEEIIRTEILEKPRAIWSVVFNAEQCEGLPAYEPKKIDFNPIEKAEEILNNSGAKIKHKAQDKAYYSPVTDTITLPLKEQFVSSEEYYRTALHELGHWTGHSSRNNRDMSGSFGTESYAKEELVAEITSFLVGTQCGLGHEPDENNIAYLKSWSKAIRNDPSYLFNAVKDADKAAKLILGKELDLIKNKNNENKMENTNNDTKLINLIDSIGSNITDEIKKKLEKEEQSFLTRQYINFTTSYADFNNTLYKKTGNHIEDYGIKYDGAYDQYYLIDNAKYKIADLPDGMDKDIETTTVKLEKYYLNYFINSLSNKLGQEKTAELGLVYDEEKGLYYCKPEERYKFLPWLAVYNEIPENDRHYLEITKQEADDLHHYALNYNELLEKYYVHKDLKHIYEDYLITTRNQQHQLNLNNSIVYIDVPIYEKEEAKKLGAKWDKNNQCWFVHADKDLSLFDKWERIDEKDLIARKEKLHQNQKENDTEKGFFKDLTVKFAWSEFDFGVKDDTILKGEEAYKFLDKLLKADIEQNKIQERMRNGEKLDEAYYYKTKFVLSYKFHTSENLNIYIGEYEFGGKEKVSEAIEHRAKTYSAQIIPKDELQNFKKEEERYLEYLQGKQVNMKNEKYILAVPYAEREKAKALGAEWDKDGRFWYCLESEKEKFFKWDIKNVENKVKSDIPLNIEEEFLNRIKSAGVLENTVIADGQKHRISVDGDKGKEQSGFYVLHSDGVANGYFMNNRTGEEIKWNSKENSYNSMTPEEKAEMKALYQARKAEREQEDKILTEKAEKALYAKFMNKETINEHSYLTNKMIEPTQNIYVGNDNTITVPLYNVDGRLKSAQYIDADGNKRFAKNTNKVGAFHIVDGNAADLKSATSIIIAEGYATAASINEAVKEPGLKVIAAMSANNLEHTVKAITEKYPAINIVIAADNDLENKVGNIGLNAAKNVSEKYKNVTVAIPKMNGKEVAGDFNDIVSKKGLSKEDGLKAIHYSIKSYIKQQDIVQNKVPDKDLKIEQKSVIER